MNGWNCQFKGGLKWTTETIQHISKGNPEKVDYCIATTWLIVSYNYKKIPDLKSLVQMIIMDERIWWWRLWIYDDETGVVAYGRLPPYWLHENNNAAKRKDGIYFFLNYPSLIWFIFERALISFLRINNGNLDNEVYALK